MFSWLDKIPFLPLLIAAIVLALLPFQSLPESHLVEKIRMLVSGTLVKPLDIFDLLMHSTPSILILIKLFRLSKKKE